MTVELAHNGLPVSTRWLFPEYQFEQMNPKEYTSVIIERILNRGSWAEIRWLFTRYQKSQISEWISQYGYRRLDRRAFHYWRWILGIDHYRLPPWETLP